MSQKQFDKQNTITLILTVLGIAFVIALLSDLIKDVRKNTSSDIVSEEGKEILADSKKRAKLQEAIDHYQEHGNWDKLYKVAE